MGPDLFRPLTAGALLAAVLQLPPVLFAAQGTRPLPPLQAEALSSQGPSQGMGCGLEGGPEAVGSLPHQRARHGHPCSLAALQPAAVQPAAQPSAAVPLTVQPAVER